MRKALYVVALILALLVMLLNLAAIAGIWFTQVQLSRASVEVMNGVDKMAQAARDDVARVESRVSTARASVQSVETAVNQISQNVADRGLAMTLLPQQKQQQLQADAQTIEESFASARQDVQTTLELLRGIGDLPFVSLPAPDPARFQEASGSLDALRTEVAQLNAEIQSFRDATSGSISRVAEPAKRVDDRLAGVQSSLAQVDDRLAATQDRARQLSQSIPTTLLVIASILTVLLLWVAFTQILVALGAWTRLRKPTGTTGGGEAPTSLES